MRNLVFVSVLLAGCGNPDENKNGGESGGGSQVAGGCSPKASCTAGGECLNIADNAGSSTPGLRLSQLTIFAPPALASGIISGVLTGGMEPHNPVCNLNGQGTPSLLLQFDTGAGTITLGGSKPVADPASGYSFVREDVNGISVAPATMQGTMGGGGDFAVTSGVDVTLPFYIDETNVLVLPLRKATVSGTLSADNNCIGSYNADGLDPANGCLPTADTPAFLNGGHLEAYITLEDADLISLPSVQQSLCVLLSGNAAEYGDGAYPAKCKRGGDGQIVFQGDWCDATNSAGTPQCFDAVHFQSEFAASGVHLL